MVRRQLTLLGNMHQLADLPCGTLALVFPVTSRGVVDVSPVFCYHRTRRCSVRWRTLEALEHVLPRHIASLATATPLWQVWLHTDS